jgi:lipoprotein-releasing system permease protein
VGIATVSILLSTSILLFTIGIVRGFQEQITEKATYFSPHIQIHPIQQSLGGTHRFFQIDPNLLQSIGKMDGVAGVYPMFLEPGILENTGQIKGVNILGLDSNFFREQLKAPPFSNIGISEMLGQSLKLEIGERASLFLGLQEQKTKRRKLELNQWINIGITSIDESTVWMPIAELQKVVKPAPEVFFTPEDSNIYSFGSNRADLRFSFEGQEVNAIFKVTKPSKGYAIINYDTLFTVNFDIIDGQVKIDKPEADHSVYGTSIGIFMQPGTDLFELDQRVFTSIPPELTTTTVMDNFPEIFGWLQLLNTNIWVLMILIGIVGATNGATTLLVIILEKVKIIGLLQGIGATKKLIQSIFWKIGLRILVRGILIGNIFFITIAFAQNHFHFLTLDREMYFLDYVPMNLELGAMVLVNIGAFLVGGFTLYFSTLFLNNINPSKALRYDP